MLSFAVIEGMSGSRLITYHNGNKVAGVCVGSVGQRVLAAEVVEMKDGERHYVETVNRIVELGHAYHAAVLERFLNEVGAGGVIVSDQPVDLPDLG